MLSLLSNNLIEEKLTELIEQTLNKNGSLYLACNEKRAFFTSEQPKRFKLWEGGKAGCFAIIVLQVYCYCKCSVALPHGEVG